MSCPAVRPGAHVHGFLGGEHWHHIGGRPSCRGCFPFQEFRPGHPQDTAAPDYMRVCQVFMDSRPCPAGGMLVVLALIRPRGASGAGRQACLCILQGRGQEPDERGEDNWPCGKVFRQVHTLQVQVRGSAPYAGQGKNGAGRPVPAPCLEDCRRQRWQPSPF